MPRGPNVSLDHGLRVPQMETSSPVMEQRIFVEAAGVFGAFCVSSSSQLSLPPSPRHPVGLLPPSLASKKEDVGLFFGWRSSERGLRRRGATFMSTSLSPNNHTMMDYLHTGIHVKGRLMGRTEGREEGGQRALCRLEDLLH